MRALFQGGPKHNTRMMLRDGLCGPLHQHYFAEAPAMQWPMSDEDLAKPVHITRIVYQLHHVERAPDGDIAVYVFVGRD